LRDDERSKGKKEQAKALSWIWSNEARVRAALMERRRIELSHSP
jgi:hypothetical protein